MKNPLKLFQREEEFEISSDEITSYQPMTDLEHFVAKTKKIVDGLDDNIQHIEGEIDRLVHHLSDLKTIREAQRLALEHMEGGL
jgi:t-SNARE complex subunit (syntaxin)